MGRNKGAEKSYAFFNAIEAKRLQTLLPGNFNQQIPILFVKLLGKKVQVIEPNKAISAVIGDPIALIGVRNMLRSVNRREKKLPYVAHDQCALTQLR